MLDVDQAGLPMLPYARSRLLQLEQRRASTGAPFLHDRVLADGTTTIDITASAVSPKIRIHSGGGAYVVAQYDGTGSDGLYYTTIKAFTQQGAVVWAVDFPGTSLRPKYRLLGISSDGSRACFLEATANTVEFKTIERGVVTTGPGPLDLTTLTVAPSSGLSRGEAAVSASYGAWQSSASARRAMFVIASSAAYTGYITVFCGSDLTPGYTTMTVVDQLVDLTGYPSFGADRELNVGYASVAGAGSLLTLHTDVKIYRVRVTGGSAPFAVTQDEVIVDAYSATLPSLATFGSLAVSPSGKLAVGYGKMWGFPWSYADWVSETITAKAALVIDGVEVRAVGSLTPEELGPSGSGNGPVTAPIAITDSGECVFTESVMLLSGVSTTQHWLRSTDFEFPPLVYALGLSLDGTAAFVADARVGYSSAIYTDSGAFAVDGALLRARLPALVEANESGASALFYWAEGTSTPTGLTMNSVRWTMQYAEDGVTPTGYGPAEHLAPGVPFSFTRVVDKPDPAPDISVTMAQQFAWTDSAPRHVMV